VLHPLSLAVLGVALALSFSPAWAQWTTVGSAGTVDEADLGIVQLGSPVSGAVAMSPAAVGTLHVRYNVVKVDLGASGNFLVVRSRFRAGDGGRVVIRLKRYSILGGGITTILMLDSNDFPLTTGWQVQETPPCTPGPVLDFGNNAYFMDVEITKTAVAGNPALGIIQVYRSPCIE
jgi:hypothetical protein